MKHINNKNIIIEKNKLNIIENNTPSPKKSQYTLKSIDLTYLTSTEIKTKINFKSAFDYKGSKEFLRSKCIALQEIFIDDKELDLEKETEKSIDNCEIIYFSINKRRKGRKLYSAKYFLTPENSFRNREKQNENTKSRGKRRNEKKKIKKGMSNNYILNYKIENIKDELNEKTQKKLLKKNYKNHEIKMFKDKKIKTLEPIKHSTKNEALDNDFSLFDIVSQL
jgi:hypothetical protein